MKVVAQDHFWLAPRAWSSAALEGLRVAAIIAITIFSIRSAGWIFRTETNLIEWLTGAGMAALFCALPAFLIFAVWTRWDIWRNNQVKPK